MKTSKDSYSRLESKKN